MIQGFGVIWSLPVIDPYPVGCKNPIYPVNQFMDSGEILIAQVNAVLFTRAAQGNKDPGAVSPARVVFFIEAKEPKLLGFGQQRVNLYGRNTEEGRILLFPIDFIQVIAAMPLLIDKQVLVGSPRCPRTGV
jgi:hypothetical protein